MFRIKDCLLMPSTTGLFSTTVILTLKPLWVMGMDKNERNPIQIHSWMMETFVLNPVPHCLDNFISEMGQVEILDPYIGGNLDFDRNPSWVVWDHLWGLDAAATGARVNIRAMWSFQNDNRGQSSLGFCWESSPSARFTNELALV